jgi:hypothetical protein
MCACISPADVHLSETLSTLRCVVSAAAQRAVGRRRRQVRGPLPCSDRRAPPCGPCCLGADWAALLMPATRTKSCPPGGRLCRYASRARSITNTPMVNSAQRRAETGALRQENEILREQLAAMQYQVGGRGSVHLRLCRDLASTGGPSRGVVSAAPSPCDRELASPCLDKPRGPSRPRLDAPQVERLEQLAAAAGAPRASAAREAAELSEELAAAQTELEAERTAGALQEARLCALASQLVGLGGWGRDPLLTAVSASQRGRQAMCSTAVELEICLSHWATLFPPKNWRRFFLSRTGQSH